MNENDFANSYLQHEETIKKVLRSKKIYDEDLLHDTYIALYEHSQQAEIRDYVNTFVSFYMTRHLRREEHESNYDCCDDRQLLHYDRADESDLAYREAVGRKMDRLLRYYVSHPQKGERNHQRACKVLRLYCQGYNEVEISNKLKISQQAVSQHLERAIARLKLVAKWL